MGGWVKSFIVLLCFCCFFLNFKFYYHWGLSDYGSSYVAYLGSGVGYRGCGVRGQVGPSVQIKQADPKISISCKYKATQLVLTLNRCCW